ncbi:MAG TPA: POTRA domain-containing protein [Pyrinomonadaceae bacterium]|jgi:outer membrane protein assembly factor BamA
MSKALLQRLRFSAQTIVLVSLFVVILSIATPAWSQAARKIARIDVEGLQNLSRENAITMTGLKIGEPFSVAVVDAAAQRLVDSGLFKTVAYRTRTAGASITIVFQVEEAKSNSSPVVFDNFIWFSDEELSEEVRHALPFFTGTAPDTGNTTEMIRRALQDLLVSRKIPGTVEYTLTETAHLFRVGGVPLAICTLHFPGSHDVSEEKLAATTKSSTDPNYSRQTALTFPRYGLYPLYRELGHLRATFGAPIAKPDTNPGCENGVDLTIPVNEGAVYSWAKAEWSGNQVLSANELDDALGMKSGEVANGKKFDKGIRDVEKAYGKHGYIQAHLNSAPEFDDAGQRVTFKIAVSEGPQYRMGTVEFRGVSEADAAALKERWKLKSGEIYDESYTNRFFREDAALLLSRIFRERHAMEKQSAPVDVRSNVNRNALTVNLVIEIKN